MRLLNVSTDRLISTKHFLFFRRESWIDKDIFPIKDQEMTVIKCLLLYIFSNKEIASKSPTLMAVLFLVFYLLN